MNELFVIDPSAPEDLKDIKAMLDRFGLSEGRFIALFPEDWPRMLTQHAAALKGLDRARFSRLLEIHKDAFLRICAEYRRARPWVENAVQLKHSFSDRSQVLGVDPNDRNLKTLKEFLWGNSLELGASRGDHIPMTAEAYRSAASPLFQQSTEVHLADRFFQLRRTNSELDRRRCAVLSNLFDEAEKSGRCEVFVLHLQQAANESSHVDEDQLVDDLEQLVADSGASRLQIEYRLYPQMDHGRYLFGIKGGLQFDWGFDQHRSNKNHVHWLSAGELAPVHKMYGLAKV